MKKKRFVIPLSVVIITLASTFYYFLFTLSGQNKLYDILGGNDFHLAYDSKEIYWFDVRHSNDPNSPMFPRLEKALVGFNPDLVLVEGGQNTFEGSRDAAIYEGESAFATYLAKQNGIKVEDIEPPFSGQVEYLQSKHPTDSVLAMYLIRQISSMQFAPDNSQWDFDKSLIELSQFLKDNGLTYKGNSLEEILNTINTFLPEPVNAANWRSIDAKKTNYVYSSEQGALFPIYNDIYNFRNIYLIDLIKKSKVAHDKIFIVMGGQHLVDTKDQLEKIYD